MVLANVSVRLVVRKDRKRVEDLAIVLRPSKRARRTKMLKQDHTSPMSLSALCTLAVVKFGDHDPPI